MVLMAYLISIPQALSLGVGKFIISHPYITGITLFSLIWKLYPLLQTKTNVWDGKELNWAEKLFYGGLASFAKDWHSYEVHDLDKLIAHRKNCLLIGYHSRSTLDIFYLLATIQCHVLVTHLLFYIPVIGSVLHLLGIIPSKGGVRDQAETRFIHALTSDDGRPLMLLPGGAHECMKDYHNRYRVMWKREPGFARVIVKEQASLGKNTKVIPFYTKNSEFILFNSVSWYTQSGRLVNYLMDIFRSGRIGILPIMMITLLFSLGFFPLPVPVKLDTYFGDPIVLRDDETSEEFATRVKVALHELIDTINGLPSSSSSTSSPSTGQQGSEEPKKASTSSSFSVVSWIYRIVYCLLRFWYFFFLGLFTFTQNLFLHTLGIAILLCFLYPILTIAEFIVRRLDPMRLNNDNNNTATTEKED